MIMEMLHQKLAHFTHGMSLMFFVMLTIDTYRVREKSRLLLFTFLLMFFWTILLLKDLGFLLDGVWENPYLSSVNLSIDLWGVPAVALFLFELLSPGWVTKSKALLIFSPFLLFTFFFAFTGTLFIFTLSLWFAHLVALCLVIFSIPVIVRYERFIHANYSQLENRTVKWLRTFVLLLYICFVTWSLAKNNASWLGDTINYLVLIVIWYFLYRNARKQIVNKVPGLFDLFSEGQLAKPQSEYPGDTHFKSEFSSLLQKIMKEEKLYLHPALSLNELAMAAGTNRTYLSDYLNHTLNVTFYDYVNSFRVTESCLLLSHEEPMRLEEIAEACGFNSLSTFRRSFHRNMHMTPVQYRKEIRFNGRSQTDTVT